MSRPVSVLQPGAPVPAGGDVAVLDGCEPPEGWLERLQDAAYADTIAATASPVAGAAPALADDAADARIAAPYPGCHYVRRSALDLCGPLDEGFAARCLAAGLQHVLTGRVVVRGPDAPAAGDPYSAEARVRHAARLRDGRFSLTIDGRYLSGPVTGTHTHVLELILAVRRLDAVDLRVVMPPSPNPEAAAALADVEQLPWADLAHAVTATDVVHRPYQVTSAEDLEILPRLGRRVVITNQDLIAYRNPTYHPSPEAWRTHRHLTRQVFGMADLVVFESAHARADALADDLIDAARTRLIGIGIDHVAVGAAEARAPAGAPDGPFLLVLGSDYRHKNRLWALRLLGTLRERGWDGALVLAGPGADHGGTSAEETAWLEQHPEVPAVRLGAVAEGEKVWLYEHAAAVLYPTTYEGFGLIPFEAAAHGTPCLWAPVASLADVLPAELATLVPWDLEASAERVLEVLHEPKPLVAAVREHAARHTWAATAETLLGVYREAAISPARTAAVAAAEALAAELARTSWEGRYWHLRNQIGDTGLALVGPDDPLLPEDARRVLAGLLRRPATRGPLLAVLRRLSRRA